jgi:superoxide dismutase, Cu-Zn family
MTPRTCLTLAALAAAILVAPGAARASPTASAQLKDGAGKPIGTATFSPVTGGVELTVKVTDLAPGPHGIHVHAVGQCEGPEFKTAGGHFNPTGKHHGLDNPEGHHGGDLPNLSVGADGHGTLKATLHGVTLGADDASLLHAGGTAVVIHAGPDDEKTDPAGNSGARVACGVIAKGR